MTQSRSALWPPVFWALLALAGALRLGYVLAYPQLPLCSGCAIAPDYVLYDEVGWNVANGLGFVGGFASRTYDLTAAVDPRAPEIGIGPVYPMFLGAVFAVEGHDPAAVRVVQAVLSTLALFPLFAVARWTFGSRTAVVATASAAVYPAFIVYSGMLLTEALSTTLLMCAIWAVIWASRGDRGGRWVLAGFVMGLMVLLRAEVLPLAGVAAALVAWRAPSRRTLVMLALYAGILGATMAPWAWRNYRVFHRFIPVSAHEGDTLWITVKGWTEWRFDDPGLRTLVRGRTYLEQQDAFHADAVREILTHPMQVARTRVERFPDFWLSGHTGYVVGLTERYADYRARGAAAASTIKALLLVLNTAWIIAGLIGLARALTVTRPVPMGVLLLAAPVACIAAMHLVLFAAPRYQVPMMPYLLVFAGSLWGGSQPGRRP